MKKNIVTVLLIAFSIFSLNSHAAQEIKLEGIFQGKNLYVMNPFASSGVGFCVFEVTVNGQLTTDEINSSAFEIDLSQFQFELGEKLTVNIKHKDDCLPKILNPEVLKPKSTFETVSINLDDDRMLTWTTKKETGKLPYDVQQFRWNKWVKVGTIQGKGTPDTYTYSYKVLPHSGGNRFRVKQTDYTKKHRYSTEVIYKSKTPPLSFSPKKVTTEIIFTGETMYEIFDYYGNILLKGNGSKVDVAGLKKGEYFINFDNNIETFKKK